MAGNAYLKKVRAGQSVEELWPLSPDRIAPVPSKNIDEWLAGYAVDRKNAIEFEPDDIIHLKFTDPSNPLKGIAPLEAASKSVDIDVDQQGWSKSALQNQGIVSGIFSFDEPFNSQDEADAVARKLNERYTGQRNAKKIGVVGQGAKYHRTALTPVEMDYMDSRKFNREEIFIIFGVPPQYAGAMEKSTYNNYQTSELVFWFGTVIPFLADIGDQLTFSLREQLADGEIILPDLSDVPAVRKAMEDKVKTAEKLYKMGVPFAQINKKFNFGFEDFDGAEESHVGGTLTSTSTPSGTSGGELTNGTAGERSASIESAAAIASPAVPLISVEGVTIDLANGKVRGLIPDLKRIVAPEKSYSLAEVRLTPDEMALQREAIAKDEMGPDVFNLLQRQSLLVMKDIEEARGSGVNAILNSFTEEMSNLLKDNYLRWGIQFGQDIVLQRAEITEDLQQSITNWLNEEQVLLEEVAAINKTSASLILDQVNESLEGGWNIGEVQQAIQDVGIFNESRALRIARTTIGTATSIGQYHAAKISGATHKVWRTSKFEVRPEHVKREGEEVRIDETFSPAFGMAVGPRFPLDNLLVPADRVNCRCSMSFAIKD